MEVPDNTQPGTLYLIPTPLVPGDLTSLTPVILDIIHVLRYLIVENARTARRLIRSTNPPYPIETVHIRELDKHLPPDPGDILSPLFDGHDIGLMSDAGSPAVADPGEILVAYAHMHGIRVIPLAGPSSILLALMASGMPGQRFCFHGYLSPKKDVLARDLRRLEEQSRRDHATQIFIETPYRNHQIVETVLNVLASGTHFCIAADLTSPDAWVRSQPISKWRKTEIPSLHKRPAVFCMSA
jgi:16S rRNA (cytidine1402-2'-O)-methyltransferase